jgi:hypothetical protein
LHSIYWIGVFRSTKTPIEYALQRRVKVFSLLLQRRVQTFLEIFFIFVLFLDKKFELK